MKNRILKSFKNAAVAFLLAAFVVLTTVACDPNVMGGTNIQQHYIPEIVFIEDHIYGANGRQIIADVLSPMVYNGSRVKVHYEATYKDGKLISTEYTWTTDVAHTEWEYGEDNRVMIRLFGSEMHGLRYTEEQLELFFGEVDLGL